MEKYFIGSINLDEYQLQSFLWKRKRLFLGGSAVNTLYFVNSLYKIFENNSINNKCNISQPLQPLNNCYIVGLIGNDVNGKKALLLLKKKGISDTFVKRINGRTGNTKIMLNKEKERTIERGESVTSQLINYISEQKTLSFLKKGDIHLKAELKVIKKILEKKEEIFSIDVSGILKSSELSIFIEELHKKNKSIKVLLGNLEEFSQLYNKIFNNTNNTYKDNKNNNIIDYLEKSIIKENNLKKIEHILTEIRKCFNSEYLFLKMGKFGAICNSNDITLKEKALKVKVIDTTGAGDAFNAGILFGLWNKWGLDLCLRLGVMLGSLNCTCYGGCELKLNKRLLKKYNKDFKKNINAIVKLR
ncbi:MAG: carbohydrate kinase family protein [Promethearchaeota archaeon]